jgi:hypothetical protein
MSVLEYHEVAQIQLDEAIKFYNQENYICATSLAGAAEGILNEMLFHHYSNLNTRSNLLEDLKIRYPELTHRDLNFGRNALKHFKLEICEDDFEIKHWAEVYILLSIGDYFNLQNKITKTMTEFWNNHSDDILNRTFESEIVQHA